MVAAYTPRIQRLQTLIQILKFGWTENKKQDA